MALGLGLTLTGCSQAGLIPRTALTAAILTNPDQRAVQRAVIATRQLRADALALARTEPTLAALLGRIATSTRAQLLALGDDDADDPSPSPSASPSAVTPEQLIQAEWTAARVALRDGEAATPAYAVLLCRIAAARAADADLISVSLGDRRLGVLKPAKAAKPAPTSSTQPNLNLPTAIPTNNVYPAGGLAPITLPTNIKLPTDTATATAGPTDPVTASPTDPAGPTPTPTGDPGSDSSSSVTPPGLAALNRLLAGQHAAVYAYPLIIARAAKNRSDLAWNLWQAHRADRDLLTDRLAGEGAQPVPTEPAYNLGRGPFTTARTVTLAVTIERGLAALAADVIAAATGADRALGADQLVLAARRTASWTGQPLALPGQLATPATPPPSTTPSTDPPSTTPTPAPS